jgi:hypothetical protein
MRRSGTVSTIVPVFNRSTLLIEAVESVLQQTYPDVEVIVVDDGSTDETWRICQKLALRDDRVRIRRLEHVGRPGLVREAGRVLARGEYIQYLDSDDLLAPERFSEMVEALEIGEKADLAYCFTRRYAVGQPPKPVPAGRTGETLTRVFPDILAERPWFTASVLYRRDICDRAGSWSDLPFMEDVELDARMGRLGARVAHRPKFLSDFRDHSLPRLSRQDLLERPEVLAEAVRAYSMIFSHARAAGVPSNSPAMSLFMEDVRLLGSRADKFLLQEESSVCAGMMKEVYGANAESGLRLSAKIEPLVTDLVAAPGMATMCPVRIVNRSTISYRDGSWPVYLSYHLMSQSGELLRHDNRRTKFDELLRPGEERVVDLEIEPLDLPGCYVLRIDLVLERITWFEAQGTEPGVVRLRVEAPSR